MHFVTVSVSKRAMQTNWKRKPLEQRDKTFLPHSWKRELTFLTARHSIRPLLPRRSFVRSARCKSAGYTWYPLFASSLRAGCRTDQQNAKCMLKCQSEHPCLSVSATHWWAEDLLAWHGPPPRLKAFDQRRLIELCKCYARTNASGAIC